MHMSAVATLRDVEEASIFVPSDEQTTTTTTTTTTRSLPLSLPLSLLHICVRS